MRLASRLFVFASLLFVVLYGVLPGFFMIQGAFVSSFVAGRNFLHGVDPILFYQFPIFQKLIDLSGFSGRALSFVTATPTSIVTDAVLAIPPVAISHILITVINIAALIFAVHLTAKISGATTTTTYFVFLSSSFALATNFQASEPFILLMLLLLLAFYAYSIGRVAACGAFLGLAFPFNPLFVVPVILFLVSAKWRAFTYFLIVAAVMLALTYVVVGQSTFVYYFEKIVPAYMNSRVLDPFSDTFQTAWSFFRRLFVFNATLNINPLFKSESAYLISSSIFRAAVVVPPAYFFYKGLSRGKPQEALAAAIFPLIFLLPVFTIAGLIMMAPAIVVNAQAALEEGHRKIAGAFIVLYVLACIPIYSLETEYLKLSSVFLNYECFILLIAIYVLYLFFQARVVPSHLRPLRFALTVIVVGAVSITLYLGDRFVQPGSAIPLEPVISGVAGAPPAFSPGLHSGRLTYVSLDFASSNFAPVGIDIGTLSKNNIYKYASGQSGHSYALETTEAGTSVAYFKTRAASATYPGRGACVSRDGDYGAFMKSGRLYLLDLDPRFIAPVDTVSLLPYEISQCSFNSDRNNEIVFVVDSLNSSFAIASYNLFSRKITRFAVTFRPSLLCAASDTFYATQEVADTTVLWQLGKGVHSKRLLNVLGNIYDITVLNHSLYLSSDFRRGLDNPTVYEYIKKTK